ncbi:MAG: ABC transporter permease [Actinobacteria bacterium]|nr:ABC transporter permease [Actinomycetota bacterium]
MTEAVRRLAAFRELVLIMIIVVSGIVMSQLSEFFFTEGNLRSVVIGMVPGAIIAIGMAVLLASGGFDLSVAAVMALCGTICAYLLSEGAPIPLAIVGALLLGALVGSGNGVLVTFLRVNPLVATLGTLLVARGLALVITEGYNISNLPPSFVQLGQEGPLDLPWMVWIMLGLVLLADLALRHTRFLRQVYYMGGNERAARLSGIRVDALRVFTYVFSGTLAGLAGVLLAARLNTAVPTAGQNLELTVIAAAVLGGASLTGGEGTVLGAALGIAFLALLSNALTLLHVSIFWQIVTTGIVLIAAVSLDMLLRRRQA